MSSEPTRLEPRVVEMRAFQVTLLFSSLFLICVGCGGGLGSAPPPPPATTTVTITLPTPDITMVAVIQGVAAQSGSGALAQVPVQNNQASFTVPSGVSRYTFAIVCVDKSDGRQLFGE